MLKEFAQLTIANPMIFVYIVLCSFFVTACIVKVTSELCYDPSRTLRRRTRNARRRSSRH